jgi:hypothetical protein
MTTHVEMSFGLRCRRAVALPLYVLALILGFSADLLGILAARITGDDWPR